MLYASIYTEQVALRSHLVIGSISYVYVGLRSIREELKMIWDGTLEVVKGSEIQLVISWKRTELKYWIGMMIMIWNRFF